MVESVTAERILVVKPRTMGDILAATPVLANLRRAFPRSHIAFLVDRKFAPALKGNPYIDELIEFDKEAMGKRWGPGRVRRELGLLAKVRARKFDLVFDLLGNLRTAILTFATGAEQRVGYNYRVRRYFYNRTVTARNPQYVVDFNLDCLRRLGIHVVDKDIHLPVDEADISFGKAWLSDRTGDSGRLLVGLFPGGGWQSKRWPEEHFARLGDLLALKQDAVVLVMGGPMEEGSVRRIASAMSRTPLTAVGLRLSRFAGILSHLDIFVSNDSGPRYLAVAAGIPSIGLFGPTSSQNANPPDPRHLAMTYGGECIECDRIFCVERVCMNGMSPETVYDAVIKLLEDQGILP